MARRNYSDVAVATTLNGAITDVATSLVVNAATGYPTAPFLIQIEDELILVGSKSGTTFSSLTRGYGATTGAAHSDDIAVIHAISATDVDEVWTHDHQTADGHAQVSHDDLSGVSSGDHHAQSHAHNGADGSGTVAHGDLTTVTSDQHHAQVHAIDGADHTGTLDHAEIATQTADDHHTEDHASRHAPNGADPLDTLDDYIKMDAAVVNSSVSSPTTSFVDYATLSLVPPAGWTTYKVMARGSVFNPSPGDMEARIEIGANNGTEVNTIDAFTDDTTIVASHYATGLTGTITIAIAIKRVSSGASATHGEISYVAVRQT